MPNISMKDNIIILEKDNGNIITFTTNKLSKDWKKSFNIKLVGIENNSGLLDIDITQDDLISVFIYYRSYCYFNYPQFFRSIGVSRTTTLDYINLKNLGVDNYSNLLGSIDNAKPFTVRDRIAYARRMNWIPKVQHGTRKVRYA